MAISGARVGSGTWASSAWRTIGASVPSTSRRMAARLGSERSGSSASASGAATDTRPMIAGMPRSRTLKLAAIGALAGVFSGLFGVGGGVIMVPLFIAWLGYEEREAAGTSLAAIMVIAGAATIVQLGYGNVHVGDGLAIGVPAVGGVLTGTWLQQRVPRRQLQILF